jgi:hypothetical protein
MPDIEPKSRFEASNQPCKHINAEIGLSEPAFMPPII